MSYPKTSAQRFRISPVKHKETKKPAHDKLMLVEGGVRSTITLMARQRYTIFHNNATFWGKIFQISNN